MYEIPFLPGMNKAAGVKRISEILCTDHGGNGMVYAGDDENDATAMEWVIRQGGMAFSVERRQSSRRPSMFPARKRWPPRFAPFSRSTGIGRGRRGLQTEARSGG